MRTIILAAVLSLAASQARAAERTFPAGSLIIPMDLAYQDTGLLQAYGLLYELLRQNVRVYWVIDPDKTFHGAACNTPGNECPWDCAEVGSAKCPYPTASPDFTATATIVADDRGTRTGTVTTHAYRGGPFVIDAADAVRARVIVDAWNDPVLATRTVFEIVSVHEAMAPFTGDVAKEMLASPTIAVFSDGNEDIATGYLRAAGIPQSNGAEFPTGRCGACGPGTANPDMLTAESVMGDLGTCAAPSQDHENGALFRADGLPAYCQIMSMHWAVTDRERVECNGGACPETQAACGNDPITYHGHETVAEVRAFLQYPVHFFAECQAVNAYENTTPNPAWPYLDDAGRDGHFLTTTGTPPACPCTDGDFECVVGGCNGADCCLPKDIRERGAGFLIAPQPAASTLKVLRPDVPYNQLDGAFGTVGGSEPAYNLSSYLGTTYKNNRQVTLLTGPQGPGLSDVWMSGYLDGACDIGPILKPGQRHVECATGKISYLGGHSFSTSTPLAATSTTQGARVFLNALFEADCVTTLGQPQVTLSVTPDTILVRELPIEADVLATYMNLGAGAALDATLVATVPAGIEIAAAAGATTTGTSATWELGSISGAPARAGDPPLNGDRATTLRISDLGDYEVTLELTYTVGTSRLAVRQNVVIRVELDTDGDGTPDGSQPSGCCSADAGPGSFVLGLLVLGLLVRRRRVTPS